MIAVFVGDQDGVQTVGFYTEQSQTALDLLVDDFDVTIVNRAEHADGPDVLAAARIGTADVGAARARRRMSSRR